MADCGYCTRSEGVNTPSRVYINLVAQKLHGDVEFESHSCVTVVWLAFHIVKHSHMQSLDVRRYSHHQVSNSVLKTIKAPPILFSDLGFVWLHVRMYVCIYIYICQDDGAMGFIDFTKLLFALSSLAQPFNRVRSIPEHFFIILSQRKACIGDIYYIWVIFIIISVIFNVMSHIT